MIFAGMRAPSSRRAVAKGLTDVFSARPAVRAEAVASAVDELAPVHRAVRVGQLPEAVRLAALEVALEGAAVGEEEAADARLAVAHDAALALRQARDGCRGDDEQATSEPRHGLRRVSPLS